MSAVAASGDGDAAAPPISATLISVSEQHDGDQTTVPSSEEELGLFSRCCQQKNKEDMRKRRTNSRRLELLAAAVDWVQRLRVPRSCCWRSSYSTVSSTDDSEQASSTAGGIPLISGLDRVVLGTVSAAEAVTLCNMKPPQYFWYMVSGSFCDIVQFLIDYTIHFAFHVQDPSVCWALSFSLSIIFRHTSHRYLVFGDYVGGYCNSLLRMYGGYSIIIVLSTIFNIFMTKLAKISHYVAWIITLLWTGLVNYFILKKLWSFGGGASKAATKQQTETIDSDLESNSKTVASSSERSAATSLKARTLGRGAAELSKLG